MQTQKNSKNQKNWTPKSVLTHFYLAFNPSFNRFTLRPGFYYLTDKVTLDKIKMRVIIDAYYHPEKPLFFTENLFEVDVKPLYNYHSVSDYKTVPPEHIMNSIIEVISVDLIDTEYQGKEKKSYKIIWRFVDYEEQQDVVKPFNCDITVDESYTRSDNEITQIEEAVSEPNVIGEDELLQLIYDDLRAEEVEMSELYQLIWDEQNNPNQDEELAD
jgi:hypothetical protein